MRRLWIPAFAGMTEGNLRATARLSAIELLDFGGEQLWVRDPDGNAVELRTPSRK